MRKYCMKIVYLLVITVFALAGCGGGTSGTSSTGGETSIRVISGTIFNADDTAAPGVKVALVGGVSTVTTDQQGTFLLEEETETEITLSLTTGERVAEVQIPTIAPDTQVVTVDAKLNQDKTSASAQTIEGRVFVSNTCRQYSTAQGDKVSLTLPTGSVECSLEYQFLSGLSGLEQARLEVSKNNCQGTTLTTTGAQVDGSVATIFQVVRANNQRGLCTATVRAVLPGARTTQNFTLKVQQRAATDETPPTPLKVVYEGRLSLETRTPTSGDCAHFNSSNTRLRFSINDTSISANLLSEGIKLTDRAQTSGTSDQERYGINQKISDTETVHVYPVASVGSPRTAFQLDYTQRSSEGVCSRSFFGVIPLKN